MTCACLDTWLDASKSIDMSTLMSIHMAVHMAKHLCAPAVVVGLPTGLLDPSSANDDSLLGLLAWGRVGPTLLFSYPLRVSRGPLHPGAPPKYLPNFVGMAITNMLVMAAKDRGTFELASLRH